MKSRRSVTISGHYTLTRSTSKLLATNFGNDRLTSSSLVFEGDNSDHISLLNKCESSLGQGALKRHKSNSINTTSFLPDEIIFNILLLLPPHVLHYVMKCVCSSWFRLISDPVFVRKHLTLSRSSQCYFGIKYDFDNKFRVHVELKNQREFHVTYPRYPFCDSFLATCDGLVLLENYKEENIRVLFLANPITREKVSLPPLPEDPEYWISSSAIAYAPSIACYKVVTLTTNKKLNVLTVGLDSAWRIIDTKSEPFAIKIVSGYDNTHCVDGHIYWFNKIHPTYLLALDIESETVCVVPTPLQKSKSYGANPVSVDKGKWIGLFDFHFITYAEVWALTCLEQVNWTKMFTIQMDVLNRDVNKVARFSFKGPIPQLIFCSSAGEVAFRVRCMPPFGLVWHDVKTGDFKVCHTEKKYHFDRFYAYVDSLVSPRNLFNFQST